MVFVVLPFCFLFVRVRRIVMCVRVAIDQQQTSAQSMLAMWRHFLGNITVPWKMFNENGILMIWPSIEEVSMSTHGVIATNEAAILCSTERFSHPTWRIKRLQNHSASDFERLHQLKMSFHFMIHSFSMACLKLNTF